MKSYKKLKESILKTTEEYQLDLLDVLYKIEDNLQYECDEVTDLINCLKNTRDEENEM